MSHSHTKLHLMQVLLELLGGLIFIFIIMVIVILMETISYIVIHGLHQRLGGKLKIIPINRYNVSKNWKNSS